MAPRFGVHKSAPHNRDRLRRALAIADFAELYDCIETDRFSDAVEPRNRLNAVGFTFKLTAYNGPGTSPSRKHGRR